MSLRLARPWEPPYPNFGAIAQQRAQEQAERIAYTFLRDGEIEEARLTFGELHAQARIVAGRLQGSTQPGDRALLVYPTGLEFVCAFLGCLYAGVIAVPVPEPLVPRHLLRLVEIVRDAQTQHILTTSKLLPAIRQRFDNNIEKEGLTWVATDKLDRFWGDAWHAMPIEADQEAFLQYTSGSTATPRGVIVSHRNLSANLQMIQDAFQVTAEDVLVSWLPLFHDMGLIVKVLQTVYTGANCILMSPFDFLRKPARWLQAISRYRGTVSGAPDFAYSLCAYKMTPEECAGLDLSSWQIAFNGAEPVRMETLERFASRFGPYGFREKALMPGYGLAEATVFVSLTPKLRGPRFFQLDDGAYQARRIVEKVGGDSATTTISCGRTEWLDQEVCVVDPETKRLCSPDEVGEIWLAGTHIARGYWQKSEETKDTFQAYLADNGPGPYLRTGDLGFIREGELVISGRIKDLIIIDGRNHYPQDIELTMEEAHQAVRKGCTAAFPIDQDGQEKLFVVVELQPPGRKEIIPELENVQRAIRRAISEQHGLRTEDIAFIKAGTILKTSSGKIQRRACREAYLSNTLKPWQTSEAARK
jgi:acyl-CoA synthetase (AMP-forming)/AMP-acid ligase II